jgi:hypothetical protein
MTAPAAIIDVVARHMGIPRATVAVQDRMLVTSGHRRITGRGRAARSTPDDAAAILLAIAATPLAGPAVKETVLNYERYAGLIAANATGELHTWELRHLSELRPGHTLKEALTAIITAIANGAKQASDLWKEAKPDKGEITTDLSVTVELEAPTPTATIKIVAVQMKPIFFTAKHCPADAAPWFLDEPVATFSAQGTYYATEAMLERYMESLPLMPSGARESPDLSQVRRFTLATIKPVAMLFSDISNTVVKS